MTSLAPRDMTSKDWSMAQCVPARGQSDGDPHETQRASVLLSVSMLSRSFARPGLLSLVFAGLTACGGVVAQSASSGDGGKPPSAEAGHPKDGASPPEAAEPSEASVGTPVAECVEPVVGSSCSSPDGAPPCAQPANPCEAGYIWSCDPGTSAWYQELITCFTGPTSQTQTTSECADDEILFVDDVAGDPCFEGEVDGGGCASGSYLIQPGCCYSATNAYCVPRPAACDAGLSCACTGSLCASNCGGAGPGVECESAVGSVVDCLCGKV